MRIDILLVLKAAQRSDRISRVYYPDVAASVDWYRAYCAAPLV